MFFFSSSYFHISASTSTSSPLLKGYSSDYRSLLLVHVYSFFSHQHFPYRCHLFGFRVVFSRPAVSGVWVISLCPKGGGAMRQEKTTLYIELNYRKWGCVSGKRSLGVYLFRRRVLLGTLCFLCHPRHVACVAVFGGRRPPDGGISVWTNAGLSEGCHERLPLSKRKWKPESFLHVRNFWC